MKKYISVLIGAVLISLIVGFSGCTESGVNNSEEVQKFSLKISGSTTVLPIAEEAAKQFMTKNKNYMIEVTGGGSGLGVKEAGENLNDIGMASRDVKSSEFEIYPSLQVFGIAKDGVAIIVQPENPVSSLTQEQIIAIYAGEITNWNEVGGNDAPITVYTRDEESGTREVFFEKALNKGNITKKAVVVASNGAMKSSVKADVNGIGYLSIGYLDSSVTGCEYEGVLPTEANVVSGTYTVSRTLNIITNGEPSQEAKAFIDFLLSSEGQKIVVEEGYIPVN
ncbi:phosphate ABC transporter substrate-binding protein [Methanococcus maripaludis]|uniref:Phosphate ABC transporter substrate-binding protein n=3 Tax=Methanococcus maripaludis TaxID=39152 RepID=A0A8T3W5U4_METMI|nr:phosphate ABC transporter substrate-binding protein [Methanococcus maripaludis]AEK20124.1 phosphate binding protein [Methanococcus maripaludis X1]MBG0768700.1 phosphate ABC transporter substrate-binding protein [Methanococcus maripaludis]BAP63288.1 phosphate ABC transporter periplasmic binding protein [Methanococcus maripaludis OS7]